MSFLTIQRMDPPQAPPEVPVLARGQGFMGTEGVMFNDIPADFEEMNDSQLQIIIPDLEPGAYQVKVQANGETSDPFMYRVL